MHKGNHTWLEDVKRQFPKHFTNAKVLEIGSLDINGSARDHFTDCEYVGVDMAPGKGVDVVSKATETSFQKEYFDTFVCLNTYEHDLEWRESLSHNLSWIKDGGLCIISFGAEGTREHFYPIFAAVPRQDFKDYCKQINLNLIESFFEEDRYGEGNKGIYDVLAIKGEPYVHRASESESSEQSQRQVL